MSVIVFPFTFKSSSLTHTHTHTKSAIALKPLTAEVNNIDYLVTVAHVRGWDILGSR